MLKVNDCTTCDYGYYDICPNVYGPYSKDDVLKWVESIDFDSNGMPINAVANCPGWIEEFIDD